MTHTPWTLTLLAAAGLLAGTVAHAQDARIEFPAGYATKYRNYLSLDRVQNPDQVIRLFANDTALAGTDDSGSLAPGSVLVAEIYAALTDAEGEVLTSSLDRRIRDRLVAIAVMEKRPGWGARFPEPLRNGDWDFAIFSPEGKALDKDLDACRACHAPLADRDHLFSYEHLVKRVVAR